MASAMSSLTVPEALNIVNQHQHDGIEPAVTSFLARKADEIWQRIQAQPSTYILTREEFTVYAYCREAFGNNEVIQQAIRRFWDQFRDQFQRHLHDKRKLNEGKEMHQKISGSAILPKSHLAAIQSPQDKSEAQDPFKPILPPLRRNSDIESFSNGHSAADNDHVANACRRCKLWKIRCNGELPACRLCKVLKRSCVYTYGRGGRTTTKLVKEMRKFDSKESDPAATPSQQDSPQLQDPSSVKGFDRADMKPVACHCAACRNRAIKNNKERLFRQLYEEEGSQVKRRKFLQVWPKETFRTKNAMIGEGLRERTQSTISLDHRIKQQDERTSQTWGLKSGYERRYHRLRPINLGQINSAVFEPHRKRDRGIISGASGLKQDEPMPQSWPAEQGYSEFSENLARDLGRLSMHVLNGEEYGLVNSIKMWVQTLTGASWDWWPLQPSCRQLLEDEVRIQWYCDSRCAHSTVLPKSVSSEAFKSKVGIRCAHSESKEPKSPSECHPSASTDTSRSSGSGKSAGSSSPVTSDSDSSDPPNEEADARKSNDRLGTNTAVEIVPPSNLAGFVLFGVHGSKRLQSACLRLAQIDISVYKDDDSFFNEMTVEYKKLRGFLRRALSIWVFHACEFIMFYKANPNEIMPGPQEMPTPQDGDYEYLGTRNPPILSDVFNASFYGCEKACIKSQLDLLCLFHQCKGRNHCGKYRVLEHLPKRRRKWDIDRDEEAEEAWGLNTVFAVSFFRVILYHMLILVAPIIFWGLWLKKWPSDWQNASVPFFAVVVLLSLFWLPFAHNASSTDRRSSKNKAI